MAITKGGGTFPLPPNPGGSETTGSNYPLLIMVLFVFFVNILTSFDRSQLELNLTENNNPHNKVILPLLLHKWASNFQSLCVHLKRGHRFLETLLWSWQYCPFNSQWMQCSKALHQKIIFTVNILHNIFLRRAPQPLLISQYCSAL